MKLYPLIPPQAGEAHPFPQACRGPSYFPPLAGGSRGVTFLSAPRLPVPPDISAPPDPAG